MPKRSYRFWVYIMTNISNNVLYVGMTNDIRRRVYEHIQGILEGFTKDNHVNKLVYMEEHQYVNNAIAREKQVKRWNRQWKVNLVESVNPAWEDLSKSNNWMTAA